MPALHRLVAEFAIVFFAAAEREPRQLRIAHKKCVGRMFFFSPAAVTALLRIAATRLLLGLTGHGNKADWQYVFVLVAVFCVVDQD